MAYYVCQFKQVQQDVKVIILKGLIASHKKCSDQSDKFVGTIIHTHPARDLYKQNSRGGVAFIFVEGQGACSPRKFSLQYPPNVYQVSRTVATNIVMHLYSAMYVHTYNMHAGKHTKHRAIR